MRETPRLTVAGCTFPIVPFVPCVAIGRVQSRVHFFYESHTPASSYWSGKTQSMLDNSNENFAHWIDTQCPVMCPSPFSLSVYLWLRILILMDKCNPCAQNQGNLSPHSIPEFLEIPMRAYKTAQLSCLSLLIALAPAFIARADDPQIPSSQIVKVDPAAGTSDGAFSDRATGREFKLGMDADEFLKEFGPADNGVGDKADYYLEGMSVTFTKNGDGKRIVAGIRFYCLNQGNFLRAKVSVGPSFASTTPPNILPIDSMRRTLLAADDWSIVCLPYDWNNPDDSAGPSQELLLTAKGREVHLRYTKGVLQFIDIVPDPFTPSVALQKAMVEAVSAKDSRAASQSMSDVRALYKEERAKYLGSKK